MCLKRICAASCALAIAITCTPPGEAMAATWDGDNSNQWNVAANWDVLPASNNPLVFSSATGLGGLNLNNNLTSGAFNVAGITYNAGAAAFVIGDGTLAANSGNTFVLTNNVANNSSNLQIINNPFSMTATRAFTTNGSGGDILLDGNISGAGSITKAGNGTLTLSGANTYTNTTTVNGGALRVDAGAGGSLNSGNNLTLNGGAFHFDNTSAAGATSQTMGALTVGVGDATVRLSRTALQNVALQFNSQTSATNENGKAVNFVIDGTPGTNGVQSKIVLADQTLYRITEPNAAYFNGSDFAVYDISGGTGVNGFVRGINYGVDDNSRTSAAGATFTSNAVSGSGTIYNQEVTGNITAQGTITLGANAGGGQQNGTLKIVGASNITLAAGATLTIENVNDTGTKGILKTGGGKSVISGGAGATINQTQRNAIIRVDGPTDILEIAIPYPIAADERFMKSGDGTLIFTTSYTLTDSRQVFWINGGVVEYGGNATIIKNANPPTILANGALLRHNSTSTTSSIAGLISGEGGVEVANGTLTLDRTTGHTYTGGTTITGGTLLATNTSGSATGTGDILLNGGFLGGTGSVSGDIIIAAGGGAVAPGLSIGTLSGTDTIWNSDNFLAGMSFELSNIDSTSDLLDLSGAFTKGTGSSFLFDFIGGTIGTTYTLVEFGSTNFVVSDFGIASGIYGDFTLNANNLQFTPAEAPVINAVPEPTAIALWLLGVVSIGWAWPRWRSLNVRTPSK